MNLHRVFRFIRIMTVLCNRNLQKKACMKIQAFFIFKMKFYPFATNVTSVCIGLPPRKNLTITFCPGLHSRREYVRS